nr:uncharacterized protein LOC111859494 isoform X1 [Paramormyrops kingsleyae]
MRGVRRRHSFATCIYTYRTVMATRSRKSDCFVWTDDEVELLLKITHEYKLSKAAENTDWESCQSKYSDILQRYKEHYPSREEAQTLAKDYPHSLEDISKVIISTKLKAVRIKYRQALDSGRRRGHGRVILLYFELCEAIWGGSPATQTIPHGIESGDMRGQTEDSLSTSTSPGSSITDAEKDPVAVAAEVERGRDRFGATLYGYKKDKLKRKLSSDLSLAQEDLNIKRKLLHRLEVTDKEFADTMGKISSTMDRLTHNIEKLTSYIVDTADVRQHLAPPQSLLCVPVESRKQVPPHAVRENTEQTMPSLPAMHSASAQVTIKKEETQGESWVEEACENKGMVKVLEGNGPQSPMLEVPQQPDGLQDTYKEQVNQLQQELEEMKRRCEHLQVMEIELQRRKAEEPPATHRPSSAHLCPYASLVRD